MAGSAGGRHLEEAMSHLPPGPRAPKLLTTHRLLAEPSKYMTQWRDRFGDPFTASAVNGTVVVTGRPDLIEAMFRADARDYDPFAAEAVAPLVGERSLFTLRGEAHRRERKLVMPPFHGARMRAYADTMAEAATAGFAPLADGTTHRMQDAMQAISLDVILRAVFGLEDDDGPDDYGEAIVGLIESAHPALIFMPFLQVELGGWGPWARFRRRFDRVDAQLDAQLARRREAPGDDILSMLLGARYEDGAAMSDTQIKDELRTMVVAGHETTALALSWAVDAVHRHPEVLARLRDEIDALGPDPNPESLARCRYLDAVIKETLRRYPILTESMRQLNAPLRWGDHDLPAGVAVAASIILAHQNPDHFPAPERFDPDRFVGKNYPPPVYLPFGGGHRRCVGAAFAHFEMKIVLGRLLADYDVALQAPSAPRPHRRNITMAPHDGVPVRLTRRRSRASGRCVSAA